MRFSETQIITFANQKGGCGKTTSCVSAAAAFVELGYSACIVDTDAQCNSTQAVGVEFEWLRKNGYETVGDLFLKQRKSARDCVLDLGERFDSRLHLIPGHHGLSSLEKQLERELSARVAQEEVSCLDEDVLRNEQRLRLRNSLDALRGEYDVVVVDTPPNLGYELITSLIASDWFVVPVFPSAYDLKGLEILTKNVNQIRKRYNPGLRLAGALLGNFDKTTKLDLQVHGLLKDMFGEEKVFQSKIPRSVKFREATFRAETIFEHAPENNGAEAFLSLAREMIRRGGGVEGVTTTPLPSPEALEDIRSAKEVMPEGGIDKVNIQEVANG